MRWLEATCWTAACLVVYPRVHHFARPTVDRSAGGSAPWGHGWAAADPQPCPRPRARGELRVSPGPAVAPDWLTPPAPATTARPHIPHRGTPRASKVVIHGAP